MRISDWSSDVCSSDLTGRDDDIFGGEGFGLAVARDRQLTRTRELALAHMDGDLVLLHQEGDALAQLLRDAARPLHDRVDVGADLLGAQAIVEIGRASCRGTSV